MGSLGSNEDKEPRFRVRAPLRCDGVGKLDCAEDVESGARMAIRWLPLDANGAAAARALELLPPHPTLPRIRSTGLRGSAAFVAMDFPDGKLLSTLQDESLDASTLARIGAEVADALATIHLQGTFHGELSTDSVLLLPERRAVLWDVPLVVANRMTDRRAAERSAYTALRAAPFLAPERARGLPPSAPADVYALGAVLCLAGGSLPPPGVTTLAVVHQIATGQWTPEAPRHFPEPMRQLVERMLATEPLMRPSATQVAEVLGRGVEGMSVTELAAIPSEELSFHPALLGLRSKAPFVAAGLVALALLALAVMGLTRWLSADEAPRLADAPLAPSALEPAPPVETERAAGPGHPLLAPLVEETGPGVPETVPVHVRAEPRADRVVPAALPSAAKVATSRAQSQRKAAPARRAAPPAAKAPAAAPASSAAAEPTRVPALNLSGLLSDADGAAPSGPAGSDTDLKRPKF